MRIYDIIKKKRDGGELSRAEIDYFIKGYTAGEIKDYQAAALLMAIYFKDLNNAETIALTEAMMHSGDVVELSAIAGIKVDKHSTGGVGDTTTMVLAPLVAACGVPIAKMSGRGLGHTGGTVDKLTAIPGFQVELTAEQFAKNVNRYGIAVIGQSKNIAPADKKLYALRDVTATVENIALIASSIMSKKLAAGSNGIVLDVKTGSGAFIKDEAGSIELAKAMVDIGNGMNRQTVAAITDMSQPLGFAIGNSIEVIEAVETLKGNGPSDLTELCLTLGAHMVVIGSRAERFEDAYNMLVEAIDSGQALAKFRDFVEAQGGNGDVVDDYSVLPTASVVHEVRAAQSGYISAFQSEEIGRCAMLLGAGRANIEAEIDLSAGIKLARKIGDKVASGDLLATFYSSRSENLSAVEAIFLDAISIVDQPCTAPELIKAIVTADEIVKCK
ncbi:MAG: pyrimidine-nucleoside phosphorylase [Clostridiales bacterium]|nr:MAG: pyrimidine-nucleoside phosphorylase [Clostridiales bacterium]